eukprot:gene23244-31570_t
MVPPLFKKRNLDKIIPVPVDDHFINDVEAGPKSTISPTSNSENSHTDFQKPNFIAYFCSIFVVVAVFAMFVPIFINIRGIQAVSYTGTFGDTLRTSTRLKIMESISIGCSLPMLSDKFLDQVTDKNAQMTLSMWHRILFLLAVSISSILYLNLSDYYFMPFLYIVLNDTKILFVGAITSYSVSNGTIMKSLRSKNIFFVPVVILGLYYVFEAYSLIFPEYLLLSSITSLLFYILFVSFCAVLFPWLYLLWCRYRVTKTLNNEEKKECVYMMTMIFFVGACQFVNAVFGYTGSWLTTRVEVCIGYIVVQIICILLATVLPTWFMRKVVQVSEAILQLKREFLECTAVSILQAFVGRLDAFKFLLSTKNIAMKVEDRAQVSEFCTPNEADSSPHDDLQPQQRERLEALSPEAVVGFNIETLSVTKHFLRIEVQDSGVGIAVEDQHRMFKQFTQFNRNLLQGGGGSGLGLWICKNLASFHGGRMGFQSEGLGKGSTFFIDLPVYTSRELHRESNPAQQQLYSLSEEEDEDEDGGDDRQGAVVHPLTLFPAPAAMPSAIARPPMRILIADDSSMNRGKRSIDEFGVGENSVDRYLQIDNEMEADDDSDSNARSHPSMRIPRQVLKAHYTRVFTETSPSPYIVHLSKSCAEMLQLQLPDETENSEALRKKFASVFVGNDFVAGLDRPYCMNYGCHCYGQWFGQLGDGRAITLGEVYTDQVGEGRDERSEYYGQHLFELQLKGSGKSPYSRGFDGKAVMRSSVREYLASECMYHLGVPTTRALSTLVSQQLGANSKFSPDALLMEPGAVVCRVSRSFLRFGNLELFAMRKEFQELVQLADFVCFKEFPYLLEDDAK